MRKIIMSVDCCKVGMRIAETVYNNFGVGIVLEGTILDQNIINKLKELGIEKVRVYPKSVDQIINYKAEVIKVQYREDVDAVKEVLHEISSGKALNAEKVKNITESIFEKINDRWDIISCINEMKEVDDYTYSHSVNVSLLCMMTAKWLGFNNVKMKLLVQAGLLHDIGKAQVPADILNKADKLTDIEFEEIKKHPVYGYKTAKKIPGIHESVLKGILMHHEREDGSGYPIGIKGENIHEFAKIIAVADIYDAMTSPKIYRRKKTPFEVFEIMENHSFGVLDTRVRTVFIENIANYYIGEKVKMNTGETGEIVFINSRHISQPVVRIGNDYIDLSFKKNYKIVEMV
ncbi:MAG: HD-GYP domain-containing protein [Acetivibrionales bacterium]|jgi:putative nucleotidyltransferase with HDIG domain